MEKKIIIYGRQYDNKSFVQILDLYSNKIIDITKQICDLILSDSFQIIPSVHNYYKSKEIRFAVSNPLVPELMLSINLFTYKLNLLYSSLAFDKDNNELRSNYAVITQYVPLLNSSLSIHKDIPITVVLPKSYILNNKIIFLERKPVLLIAYGSYGISLPISYSIELSELIQKGWVIVFAHVRGGGERGISWYNEGKLLNKWNTFNDYITCANYLIKEGFTNSSLLCGMMSSAGGLIAGVVNNIKPNLFKGFILRNPFIDVLNTMLNSKLSLTVHEYDEWGNPAKDKKVYQYIRSYSPIENINSSKKLLRTNSNRSVIKQLFNFPKDKMLNQLIRSKSRIDHISIKSSKYFLQKNSKQYVLDRLYKYPKAKSIQNYKTQLYLSLSVNDEKVDLNGTLTYIKKLCNFSNIKVYVYYINNYGHDGPYDIDDRLIMHANEINFLDDILQLKSN